MRLHTLKYRFCPSLLDEGQEMTTGASGFIPFHFTGSCDRPYLLALNTKLHHIQNLNPNIKQLSILRTASINIRFLRNIMRLEE